MRRLLASGLPVHSVLLTPPRLATLADVLDGGGALPGLRRGAAGARRASPASTSTAAAWRSASARRRAPLPRGARARGRARGSDRRRQPGRDRAQRRRVRRGRAGAVAALRGSVLSQGDPGLAGRVFTLPVVRARALAGRSRRRCATGGFALVGAVVDAAARRRSRASRRRARFALLLGAEGPGLSRRRVAALRSPGHDPDVAGRRFAERRDRRRDFPLRLTRPARDRRASAGSSRR